MYIDNLIRFWDNQDLNNSTGNVLEGDVIDLGSRSAGRNIGNGEPMYLVVAIRSGATKANATTRIQLRHADNAALTTNNETVGDTGVLAQANLAKGKKYVITLPVKTLRRYLGLWVTTGTAAQTGLRADAFLSPVPLSWSAIKDWRT